MTAILYRQTGNDMPEFYAGDDVWVGDPRFALPFDNSTGSSVGDERLIVIDEPVSIEWRNRHGAVMVTVVCNSIDKLASSILMRLRPKSREVYRKIIVSDLQRWHMIVTDQHAGNGRSFRGYWLPS